MDGWRAEDAAAPAWGKSLPEKRIEADGPYQKALLICGDT